ncbi:MAG: type II toxin-antitoxin system RelE/ParE family toxin [Balneolales bacterium]|nr:type II toxin-antitoxin system RelE/ParE family toxin [Balneolales bacterium]
MREIKFYTTQSGKSPITNFLDSLNSKQAKRVTWVLNLVEQKDRVPREYFKKLSGTSGIWEVRVQSGSDIFRLLGFIDDGKFVVLTNGFVKKSQKTPKNEIDIAENRKSDYLNRKGESA